MAFRGKSELAHYRGPVRCAYCGKNLEMEHDWLLSCADRVIPTGELARLGLDKEFPAIIDNLVLCCTGCRAVSEDYAVPDELLPKDANPGSMARFRDRVFSHRKGMIAERRAWLLTQSPKTLSDFVKESVSNAMRRKAA